MTYLKDFLNLVTRKMLNFIHVFNVSIIKRIFCQNQITYLSFYQILKIQYIVLTFKLDIYPMRQITSRDDQNMSI